MQINQHGVETIAPRAKQQFLQHINRLYEQTRQDRHCSRVSQQGHDIQRVINYIKKWTIWLATYWPEPQTISQHVRVLLQSANVSNVTADYI